MNNIHIQQKKPNKASNTFKLKHRDHYTKKNGSYKPKHKFLSKENADDFIEKHQLFSKKYKSYFCEFCQSWHIGYDNNGKDSGNANSTNS